MATIDQDINITPENISDSHLSLEDFLRLYSDVEDGFKYEYNKGLIEKTKRMNQLQVIFFDILNRLFSKTSRYKKGGVFTQETDMKTSEQQLRIPDLSIYNFDQKIKMINGKIKLRYG